MAKQLFANNASSLLAASISDTDLTIQVQSGFGAEFPNPGSDEYFLVTLENADGDIEIVKIESRSVDLLTVAASGRGQEGTSAQAWTNGQTRVECRLTKGSLDTFIQRGGDQMAGDLDMDDNELQNAKLTGTNTQILQGEIVDVPLRGNAGDSSNEVRAPTDGTRATAGGLKILVEGDTELARTAVFEVGMISLWFGAEGDCPDGFAICNGSNGTPDMRGLVPVGVSGSHALNSTGGSETAGGSMGSAGGHTHTVTTGAHTLTIDEIPAHTHLVGARGSNASSNNEPQDFVNDYPGPGVPAVTSETGGGGSHTHSGGSTSSDGAHTHSLGSVSVMQPFRALHFIMFIGF